MPTKKEKGQESGKAEKETKPLFEASRKVLLAAIGAISLAQDEVEDFVDKLVERGEIAEKDGNKLVHEVMEKRKKILRKVEDRAGKHFQEALGQMSVPTKKDIDDLSAKIADLTKKIEELKTKDA